MQSTRLVLIAAAILFAIGTAPTINGHAILPSELIGLAECYKHYDYHRPLPQMDAEQAYKHGDEQFTHFFDPFLQIQSEIDECLKQKALKEVEKLKEHIFKESGISKWLENESAKLKKMHGQIGTKKIPGFDGVLAVMTLNDWRRTLMAFGLASKNFAQVFASTLIGHILDDDHHKHPAAAGRHIVSPAGHAFWQWTIRGRGMGGQELGRPKGLTTAKRQLLVDSVAQNKVRVNG
jgi:hypothetical protein